MAKRRILIVGGSTRAAADSVRRAGWTPICADLFADLDLRSTAEIVPVTQYPASLPDDVANVQADAWFYCGALENRPDILCQMLRPNASYGPLIGTAPEALRFVRNPEWLASAQRNAGLTPLDVASQSEPPPTDGSWLQKPLAGAGGRLIRVWDEVATRLPFDEPHYFQRRAVGIGFSAVFRVEEGKIEWMGASRELPLSSTFSPSTEFTYCGSSGPLDPGLFAASSEPRSLPENHASFAATGHFSESSRNGLETIEVIGKVTDSIAVQRQLTTIAQILAKRVPGLRGLTGLDFRLDGDQVWLTEVNPRYTASVEILELVNGRSCLNRDVSHRRSASRRISKQILYATRTFTAPDLSNFVVPANPWDMSVVADIPVPGIQIDSGWPICTVLAAGMTDAEVESNLRERTALIEAALNP